MVIRYAQQMARVMYNIEVDGDHDFFIMKKDAIKPRSIIIFGAHMINEFLKRSMEVLVKKYGYAVI